MSQQNSQYGSGGFDPNRLPPPYPPLGYQPAPAKYSKAGRPEDWPAPVDSEQPTPDLGLAPNPWATPQNGQPPAPGVYGYNGYPQPNYGPPPANMHLRYYQPPAAPYDPRAEAYRQAVKKVNARFAFYKHLTVYLIANSILWLIALTSYHSYYSSASAYLWPLWISLPWGIGLASQWWNIFKNDENRRQQMIEEEMRRMGGPGSGGPGPLV